MTAVSFVKTNNRGGARKGGSMFIILVRIKNNSTNERKWETNHAVDPIFAHLKGAKWHLDSLYGFILYNIMNVCMRLNRTKGKFMLLSVY